ncbi:MAG: hypothetical protein JKY37_22240, partial [Nannocystaceae bacterium]|nr:hypothetical protein [Nannocystaceae bacterium]
AAAAGLFAGWAVSADYLVGVLALGMAVAACDWRSEARLIVWVAAGSLPIVGATLAYHDAAFGSPLSIGYDHQANFEFARNRLSTFSGNPLTGLWTLWGLGEGAGVLAMSPIAGFGLLGLAVSPWRRVALAAVPWVVLLSFHKTPGGGGSVDHRYLVPLIPVLALGLGVLWQRWVTDGGASRRLLGAALVTLALASGFMVWSHFLQVRA